MPRWFQRRPDSDAPYLHLVEAHSPADRVVQRNCPLCRDDNADVAPGPHSLGKWVVKSCRRCRMVYQVSAPDYSLLASERAWEHSSKAEESYRQATRPVLNTLSKRTRWRLHVFRRRNIVTLVERHARPGNVVDLGCGDGSLCAQIGTAFRPFGVEITELGASNATRRLAARGGYAVQAPCLEGLQRFADGFFTAAIMRSYLEHETQPLEVLETLHRKLAPGGIVAIKVPNYGSLNRALMGRRWCGFRHPDHVNYFTPATLRAMARKAGYRVRSPIGYRLPTSDNMYALLTRA